MFSFVIDSRYKFSILDNISIKSDTSQNLVSSFLFTSADLLTTIKLFLARIRRYFRIYFTTETDEMKVEDVISVSH